VASEWRAVERSSNDREVQSAGVLCLTLGNVENASGRRERTANYGRSKQTFLAFTFFTTGDLADFAIVLEFCLARR
jgi:hypothetical protein